MLHDYSEFDGEVRFGDLWGCNDPIFILASYQYVAYYMLSLENKTLTEFI